VRKKNEVKNVNHSHVLMKDLINFCPKKLIVRKYPANQSTHVSRVTIIFIPGRKIKFPKEKLKKLSSHLIVCKKIKE